MEETSDLSRENVLTFLKHVRPDLSPEDWKRADVVAVLTWALPRWVKMEKDMKEETDG